MTQQGRVIWQDGQATDWVAVPAARKWAKAEAGSRVETREKPVAAVVEVAEADRPTPGELEDWTLRHGYCPITGSLGSE